LCLLVKDGSSVFGPGHNHGGRRSVSLTRPDL